MMKNNDILRNKPNPFDFFFQRANAMMKVWLLNPVCFMTWNAMHFRQGVSLYAYMGIMHTPSGFTCKDHPKVSPHTSDEDVQWIHELCSSVSGVAVWGHFELF